MTELRQLLRRLVNQPIPGNKVKIVGRPVNKTLLGRTGVLVKYDGVFVEIDGKEHYFSTRSIELTED